MRTPVVLALLSLFVFAVACSLGGPATASEPVNASQALDPSTEPLPVRLTADVGRAVSATIPVDGGTLEAADANGTRFTLRVPSGALAEPTTITMTPVLSMDGIPFGEGSPMAVQLEPAGLRFYDFVTLTIEPADDIPLEQQVPIGTQGEENHLFMPLAAIGDGVLRLHLLHFSSAGATKGFLADTEPWKERLGGDVEARLSSLVARELLFYEQRGEPVPESFWDWVKRTWRDLVLRPRLDAAGQSCAAGRLAIETTLSFQRLAEFMGWAEDAQQMLGEAWALAPTVARTCVREEYELCRDEHIVQRMLPLITGLERMQQLAGLEAEMDSVLAEAVELARKCLGFELEMESRAEGLFPSSVGSLRFVSAREGQVPVVLVASEPGSGFELRGASRLDNVEFATEVTTRCTVVDHPGGVEFKVLALAWETLPPDAAHPYGSIRGIRLAYEPGVSSESITVICPLAAPVTSPAALWSAAHMQVRVGSLSPLDPSVSLPTTPDPALLPGLGMFGAGVPLGESGASAVWGSAYVLEAWVVHGGEQFATTEWAYSTGQVSETGSATLHHQPQ